MKNIQNMTFTVQELKVHEGVFGAEVKVHHMEFHLNITHVHYI